MKNKNMYLSLVYIKILWSIYIYIIFVVVSLSDHPNIFGFSNTFVTQLAAVLRASSRRITASVAFAVEAASSSRGAEEASGWVRFL